MKAVKKLTKTQEKKIEKITEKLKENPEMILWVEITIAKFEESTKEKGN